MGELNHVQPQLLLVRQIGDVESSLRIDIPKNMPYQPDDDLSELWEYVIENYPNWTPYAFVSS